MENLELHARAKDELAEHIEGNPYPGRGLVLGLSADGSAWLLLYWIMGRSPGSRARRLVVDGTTLRTEPVASAAGGDPALLFYEAMLELPGLHLVGNGDQTRTLRDALAAGGSFESALETREHEDDPPHYTSRISGLLDLRGGSARLALSLLRASRVDPSLTDRHTFRPAPPPGLGLGLTTYRGDATPLPPFRGEPLWLPLPGAAEDVLDRYWDALDGVNRVALAVKRVPLGGGRSSLLVRNRHAMTA